MLNMKVASVEYRGGLTSGGNLISSGRCLPARMTIDMHSLAYSTGMPNVYLRSTFENRSSEKKVKKIVGTTFSAWPPGSIVRGGKTR